MTNEGRFFMNEGNFLSDLAKTIKVPADISKAALEPSARQIGQSLGDLFYIAFSPITKARYKIEAKITLFKEEIEKELEKIPPQQLVAPPLNVVGPALEASKYYIENDELRSLFSKLIASAMKSPTSKYAHSSFVEIIKQLSPLDAQNFRFLVQNPSVGVGGITLTRINMSGFSEVLSRFFPFPDLNYRNQHEYSSSIDNLVRLGLLNVIEMKVFTDKTRYDDLKKHPLLQHYIDLYEKDGTIKVELREAYWQLTDFGKLFAQCCL